MLADAGLDKESFTSKLDFAQVDAGLTLLLSRNKLDTFVSVMKNLTKAGYTAWQFAGKRSREILSDELLLLLETGRTEYCVKIVESLSECGFLTKKLIDSARVIASCAKSWNLSLAYRFVKLLSRKPWHYNLMIREFSYNHQLQSSFDVLDIMREFGVAPDLYTYRALIDSCGRCNESSKAAVVFETMLKDGFKPNVFVYNSLMNVSVGDLDEVQRYYQHMQGAGITGNLASFNILLKAYAACGRADLAADLYFRIQQTGELNLDVVSYNAVINVFGRAKMWEKALRVKADIIEAGVTPNVVTWTSIIEACATAGLVERVFQEFDEMLSAGCCPNVDCYNALLQACVMAGQNERAFQLFQEWKQTGQIRPLSDHLNHPDPLCRTYELIAVSDIFPRPSPSWNGYIDEENWDSLRLSRCKPNLLTYNWMMKACGAAPERIRSLMLEMQAFNLIPDVTSWSILLGAYGSNGDLEGCMDTFKEMRRARFKPDVVAYTTLIKACVLFGESDMAFEIFQEMKAAGVRPNAVTYNTLIRGHRSHSQLFQVQRALAIYEEMREAGHTLNDFTLQGLIKEWGEGLSDGRPSSYVDSEKGFLEYTEALVQKVAAHARDHNDNSIVDLHGLSMGEARAAVLAVLRTIKERFLLGNPVTGDLVINTGVGHHSEDKGVSILRDVVLGVLQEELGLCVESVLADVPGQASSSQLGSSGSSDGSSSHLPRTPVRPHRPVNLGRLKVIKESLNAWLGRKSQTVTDRQ
ncbi:pentatricopeptide repeat-containing protein At5g02830, chloroplastic isoform X2 [Physcomitrium patens]|nr:pentatricopeptide repeat-containing protein At5g02830, chloroplastic-like isoform X2 [Physcomitrium patens]|eukprot:XP_024359813.1 pentatricopeptide repeat-containing protein At5g02830, chloroplastic-like isoform X2 [Physcomitrella patens]